MTLCSRRSLLRSRVRLEYSRRLFAFLYVDIALATSGLDTYNSGWFTTTGVPVSTSNREIGPLTCVIACVVWSASQSTVPVVRTVEDHETLRTSTILSCGI